MEAPNISHMMGPNAHKHIVLLGSLAGIAMLGLYVMNRHSATATPPPSVDDTGGTGGGAGATGVDLQDIIDRLKNIEDNQGPTGASIDIEFGYNNTTEFDQNFSGEKTYAFGSGSASQGSSGGGGGINVGGWSITGGGSSSHGSSNQLSEASYSSYDRGYDDIYGDTYSGSFKGSGLTASQVTEIMNWINSSAGSYEDRIQSQLDRQNRDNEHYDTINKGFNERSRLGLGTVLNNS